MNTINVNNVKNICTTNKFPKNPKYFAQESIAHMLVLPPDKPPIKSIISIVAESEIVSQRLVESYIGVSNEGNISPGYKLIVDIKFNQRVRYEPLDCDVPLQMLHLESEIYSFSIALPCEINGVNVCELDRRKKIKVIPYIEDIYTELINSCNVLQSITFFINSIIE